MDGVPGWRRPCPRATLDDCIYTQEPHAKPIQTTITPPSTFILAKSIFKAPYASNFLVAMPKSLHAQLLPDLQAEAEMAAALQRRALDELEIMVKENARLLRYDQDLETPLYCALRVLHELIEMEVTANKRGWDWDSPEPPTTDE